MEDENQVAEDTLEKSKTDIDDNMAPQDSEGVVSDSDVGQVEQKENKDPMFVNNKGRETDNVSVEIEKKVEQMTMPANDKDDGEVGEDAEDGEILEDGEIASDNDDGEINEEEKEEGEELPSPSKVEKKSRDSKHRDDHKRRGHDRRERHSKRRRTSKEDSHKEKQKKKRHKDYDFDKSGDDYDSSWSDSRREKGDRRHDHSPGHDSHGEDKRKHDKDSDKHRRGSGESRHRSSKDKDRVRDKDKRDRDHDKHDWDKSEKKDRGRHGAGKDANYGYADDHDISPPGIYDSPSDDEYDASKYTEKKSKFDAEEDYVDMDHENVKGKRKQKKFDRRRPREGGEFEEEPPAKKKPLLQTPMEERPVCRFFKEGKCQKGVDCQFNHDYQPQKRFALCKYHLQSYCMKEGCIYMHEDFPCKYFHTGSTCYQGDKCKFSHDPLTEETELALKNLLKEKEMYKEEEFNEKKHKKKGLLGDQPVMTEDEIQRKLTTMKSIPSIFDIETHKPGDSPNKPPMNMGQPPNMGAPGPFSDNKMNQQSGPNMRFQGPPNQMNNQVRPPFLGPAAPGMEVPAMGMQGPPMSGAMVSAPGLMGPGPAPMMSTPGMQGPGMQGPGMQGPGMQGTGMQGPGMQGPGMQGPGMQGNPMGPPMSQAAALVGAILRAAPMLQGYRGPGPQAPNTMPNTVPNDPRFMGPGMMGMGPPNMEVPNMMVPPPNMGGPMMSPGQDGMVGDNNQGIMGAGPNMTGGQDFNQPPPQLPAQNAQSGAGNVRDPRKSGAQNDPRLSKGGDSDMTDMDMRSGQSNSKFGDEDLRQDVDMRKEEASSNQGDHTPQQDWDDESMDISNDDDDDDIPSHLPPKQREMFLRIKQHTMKMKREKSQQEKKQQQQQQQKQQTEQKNQHSMKLDDDKWYSSDEEDDVKQPNVPNVINSLSQGDTKNSEAKTSGTSSSIDVWQMINAVKNSNSSTSAAPDRPMDPRKPLTHVKPVIPVREPANIYSRDGDCPWRLCRVLYVRDRIPDNIDLNDEKYKLDPRVQKIVKLQEIESGHVIDHTKTTVPMKSDYSESKLPNLLDPKVFQEKQASAARPELAPFVDPRLGAKQDSPAQRNAETVPPKPFDPRLKPGADPRVQRMSSNPGMTSRLSDPRLSRQDSNSNSAPTPSSRMDPRMGRQNSNSNDMKTNFPPVISRQSSIPEPKIASLESLPRLPIDLGLGVGGAGDPRLTKVTDSEPSIQLQRQSSQSGNQSDRDSSGDSPKPKLDYRNDPRFRRKRITEQAAAGNSPESQTKRLMGQRKSSTEYSSPLGGDSANSSEEGGYNSYNRPRPTVKTTTQSHASNVPKTEAGGSPDMSTHEILDSLNIMPPPVLEAPQNPDKNLKDIFKTIDPTASPFC